MKQQNDTSGEFLPPNLAKALDKIEAGGAVPVMITRELEEFLTEQGRYSSSLTPAQAWQILQEIASRPPTGVAEAEISPDGQPQAAAALDEQEPGQDSQT